MLQKRDLQLKRLVSKLGKALPPTSERYVAVAFAAGYRAGCRECAEAGLAFREPITEHALGYDAGYKAHADECRKLARRGPK